MEERRVERRFKPDLSIFWDLGEEGEGIFMSVITQEGKGRREDVSTKSSVIIVEGFRGVEGWEVKRLAKFSDVIKLWMGWGEEKA